MIFCVNLTKNISVEDEQNMLAFQTNGKIFYRVIKPIRINQELLGMWKAT